MTLSDAYLWARIRKSDEEAFSALFERHADAIYNYCFRRTGDWSRAEDLVSIVFLEAWRKRGMDLGDGQVLPWLYGVATNVIRNQRRSDRRFAAALRRLPEPQPEPDFAQTSEERIDDEIQSGMAIARVRELPRREQEVFVLCAWMGLSYDEAALALDLPIGTIRSRLSRARTRLRELDSGDRTFRG